MIGRAEERPGCTLGQVHTQRDRCCLEHTLETPYVSGLGVFGPSGTWPARAPAETGPHRRGKGREDSAAQLMTAVNVHAPVVVEAGHTCGSPLMVVCLMARAGAVRLANDRVGVTTTGRTTSVVVTYRACLECVAVVAMCGASRVLRAMVRH